MLFTYTIGSFPNRVQMFSISGEKTEKSQQTRWRCCQSDDNLSPIGATRVKRTIPSGDKRLPLSQSDCAASFVGLTIDKVALGSEVIVKRGMD